jgi:hypothetical protein
MTAFHTIAIPHDDILQGRLTMDVFAADLWEVFKGRGVDEYKKPELFSAIPVMSYFKLIFSKRRAKIELNTHLIQKLRKIQPNSS